MDKTLKELKKIRDETEVRFRSLLDELDESRGRLRGAADQLRAAAKASAEGSAKQAQQVIEEMLNLQEGCLHLQERLIEGLREMMALDNARSAELARQLTVLPLERMDLALDEFERRLEAQECELQRLQKKVSDAPASGSEERKP